MARMRSSRPPEVRRIGDARELLGAGELETEREFLEGVDWWWCLHCERVWHVDELRLTREGRRWYLGCGDAACDGSLLDLVDYHEHRVEREISWWPAEVTSGQAVPLYER